MPYVGDNITYGTKAFTFNGKVTIHFTCLEETDKIVLHSKDLTITSTSLLPNSNDSSLEENFEIDSKTDFLTLHTNGKLKKKENYAVVIHFSGIILDKLYGFYRSSYTNKLDKKTYQWAFLIFDLTKKKMLF